MGGLTIGPVPTLSSDDAFAEVKANVDLGKVVQEHVRLTKRNKDFWGLCPFHEEDSPSFKVNPQMQSCTASAASARATFSRSSSSSRRPTSGAHSSFSPN